MPSTQSSVRFVPETTTSLDYTCWTLYAGDEVLASTLTSSLATRDEAWRKMRAEWTWQAGFWAAVESGDPDTLAAFLKERR